MRPPRRRRGFSLIELLTVLTILGILAMIATPSLSRAVQMQKVRTTLDRLAVDVYYARALAAREGQRVTIEFTPGDAERCPPVLNFKPISRYSVRVAGSASAAKSVAFANEVSAVCVLTTGEASATISSSGRVSPSLSRTVLARSGGASDSLRISFVGRVLRSF